MARLYLMRHGQTEYNLRGFVQGRCDAPLTPLGVAQAHASGRWLAAQGLQLSRICCSPLGRTQATAAIVREELAAAQTVSGGAATVPEAELVDGLVERCYGEFEAGPVADVPVDVWEPGESLVPYGGEGSAQVRERMVHALTGIMDAAEPRDNVLAISHGSASLQFKRAWERLARCPQDAALGNCCVLVYDYDPDAHAFINVEIFNPEV